MQLRLLGDLNSHQVGFCLSASPSSSLFAFIFFTISSSHHPLLKIYFSSPVLQMKLKDSLLQSFLLTRFDYECKTLFLTNMHFWCVFTYRPLKNAVSNLPKYSFIFCIIIGTFQKLKETWAEFIGS